MVDHFTFLKRTTYTPFNYGSVNKLMLPSDPHTSVTIGVAVTCPSPAEIGELKARKRALFNITVQTEVRHQISSRSVVSASR